MFGKRRFNAPMRITSVVAIVSFFGILLHWISSLHAKVEESPAMDELQIFFHRNPRGIRHPKFPPVPEALETAAPKQAPGTPKTLVKLRGRRSKLKRVKRAAKGEDGGKLPEGSFPTTPMDSSARSVGKRISSSINARSHATSPAGLSRDKRGTFNWEIRANVSYKGSRAAENETTERPNDTSDDQYIGSAVFVEGKDTEQDGTNFFSTWDLVGQFFSQLFRAKQSRKDQTSSSHSIQQISQRNFGHSNVQKVDPLSARKTKPQGESLLLESPPESLDREDDRKEDNVTGLPRKSHTSIDNNETAEAKNNRSARIIMNWFRFGRATTKEATTTEGGISELDSLTLEPLESSNPPQEDSPNPLISQQDCEDCETKERALNLTTNAGNLSLAEGCEVDCGLNAANNFSDPGSLEYDCERCRTEGFILNSTTNSETLRRAGGCINGCHSIEPSSTDNISDTDYFEPDCDDCQTVVLVNTKGTQNFANDESCDFGECDQEQTEKSEFDCACEDHPQPRDSANFTSQGDIKPGLNISAPYAVQPYECNCDGTNVSSHSLTGTRVEVNAAITTPVSLENDTVSLASLAEFCFTQILSKEKLKELSDSLSQENDAKKNQTKMLRTGSASMSNKEVQRLWNDLRFNVSNDASVKKLDEALHEAVRQSKTPAEEVPSNRQTRLISFGFFDFFGSGSRARMIGENSNQEIPLDELNDETTPAPQPVLVGPIDPSCVGFFRDILSNENHITKPNLMDVIMFTNSEVKPAASPTNTVAAVEEPCDEMCSYDEGTAAGRGHELEAPVFSSEIEVLETTTHSMLGDPRMESDSLTLQEHHVATEADIKCESCAMEQEQTVLLSRNLIRANVTENKTDDSQRERQPFTNLSENIEDCNSTDADSEERRFFGLIFGSGDTRNILNESDSSILDLEDSNGMLSQFLPTTLEDGELVIAADHSNGTIDSEERWFIDLLGSGEGRELTSEAIGNETQERSYSENIFGSGDGREMVEESGTAEDHSFSLMNPCGSDDRTASDEVPCDETTETQERWFIGSILGSGDSRDISEGHNETTEPSERRFLGFLFGSGSGDSRSMLEDSADVLSTNTSSGLIYDVEEPEGLECDSEECEPHPQQSEAMAQLGRSNATTSPADDVTGKQERAIMEASTTNDYFTEDSYAKIEFDLKEDTTATSETTLTTKSVQESSTLRDSSSVSAINLRLRGRSYRLLDMSEDCDYTDCESIENEPVENSDSDWFDRVTKTESIPLAYQNPDSAGEDCDDCELQESLETYSKSELTTSKLESLLDVPPCDSCFDETSAAADRTRNIEDTTFPKTPPVETSTGEVVSQTSHLPLPKSYSTEESPADSPHAKEPRFCRSFRQCSSALNERCVPKESSFVCDCGRSFVRNPQTRKCETKVVIEASLRFPDEVYEEDLDDPRSERFKQMKRAAEDTMWALIEIDPEFSRSVAAIEVSGFSAGSLVVHWTVVLATPENESLSELSSHLDDSLTASLQQEQVLKRIPLNASHASVLKIHQALNPCDHRDLHYCSSNADCKRDDGRPGGFLCKCRAGYADRSEDRNHPGEVCQAVCEQDFCGEHGVCQLNFDGVPECLCTGWFFGEKCQISGVVIVTGTTAGNAAIVLLVLMCLCCMKTRRQRRSEYGEREDTILARLTRRGRESMQPQHATTRRLSADDMKLAPPFMFHVVPTPPLADSATHGPPPLIHVIPPSLSEYSCAIDSTFDTSPSSNDVFDSQQITSAC